MKPTYKEKREQLLLKLREEDAKYVYDPLFAELNKVQLQRRKKIIAEIDDLDRKHANENR